MVTWPRSRPSCDEGLWWNSGSLGAGILAESTTTGDVASAEGLEGRGGNPARGAGTWTLLPGRLAPVRGRRAPPLDTDSVCVNSIELYFSLLEERKTFVTARYMAQVLSDC